jgi:hypothetical protein
MVLVLVATHMAVNVLTERAFSLSELIAGGATVQQYHGEGEEYQG